MNAPTKLKGNAVSEVRMRGPVTTQMDLLRGAEYYDLAHRHQLFPSHPWAVRSAVEALGPLIFSNWPEIPAGTVVYDPCAGLGHMCEPLREFFPDVRASDIHDWGKGYAIADAMEFEAEPIRQPVIGLFRRLLSLFRSEPKPLKIAFMNPPFDGELGDMAMKFIRQAQKTCDHVIVIQRLAFICGGDRYELHHNNPIGNLKHFMPCTERCPMQLGDYNPKCSKPQEHAWFHYERGHTGPYTGINMPKGNRKKHFRPEDVQI